VINVALNGLRPLWFKHEWYFERRESAASLCLCGVFRLAFKLIRKDQKNAICPMAACCGNVGDPSVQIGPLPKIGCVRHQGRSVNVSVHFAPSRTIRRYGSTEELVLGGGANRPRRSWYPARWALLRNGYGAIECIQYLGVGALFGVVPVVNKLANLAKTISVRTDGFSEYPERHVDGHMRCNADFYYSVAHTDAV
jgi:hypothetical protein